MEVALFVFFDQEPIEGHDGSRVGLRPGFFVCGTEGISPGLRREFLNTRGTTVVPTKKAPTGVETKSFKIWSQRPDSNRRPAHYE